MAERYISPSNMMSNPTSEPGLGFRNVTTIVGAIVSLALLIGVGVWSYNLIIRDVSGVPVVRAAEGPIRVQPEAPGGTQALHQGLAVNAVAAIGETSRPADRLILAPAPLSLSAEDTPVQTTTSASEPVQSPSLDVSPGAERQDAAPVDSSQAQLAGLTEPMSSQSAGSDAEGQEQASDVLGATVEGGVGLVRSLRPRVRPADLGDVGEAIALQVAALQPIDPESVLPGTGMAQLGSFDTEAQARDAWIVLSAQFAAFLDGKQQVIQNAENGGRSFYRLRALGFEDISDARRFCSALVAEGAECIPVISR